MMDAATRVAGDQAQAVAGTAEFLRWLRSGLDEGLGPMNAAERAAEALPKKLRDSVQRMGRRMAGRYHEDEWGFDEEFAEAVYPFFEFLYDAWWRGQATGGENVPPPRPAPVGSNHSRSLFPLRSEEHTAELPSQSKLL